MVLENPGGHSFKPEITDFYFSYSLIILRTHLASIEYSIQSFPEITAGFRNRIRI